MTAAVIDFPVRRAKPKPASDPFSLDHIMIAIERPFTKKLQAAAGRAGSTVDRMASALIIHGLAAIERKSLDEFYRENVPLDLPQIPPSDHRS